MITGQVKGDQWIFAKKPYCLVILLQTAWTITVSQHPSGRKDVTRWEDPSSHGTLTTGKVNEN